MANTRRIRSAHAQARRARSVACDGGEGAGGAGRGEATGADPGGTGPAPALAPGVPGLAGPNVVAGGAGDAGGATPV
jgi:hypothetical protein